MRDRFEETMLTIVRCASALAMAVGLIFALETVPAARAQVTIDVSKITCNQLIDREVGEPRDIAIWLSGYYHGKRGETTVDKLKLLNKYVKEVRDYCFRNPQTSVMQAVETLIADQIASPCLPGAVPALVALPPATTVTLAQWPHVAGGDQPKACRTSNRDCFAAVRKSASGT